jgi:effector-binding domain-containing protein
METISTYEIKEISWPKTTFVTKRALLGFDKLSRFFSESYKDIYTALNRSGSTLGNSSWAIYYSVDKQKMETDVAAGVAVSEPENVPVEFAKVTIPQSRALLVTYYGAYESMAYAYSELDKYSEKNKLKKSWVLEEYFSDPAKEPDPAKWKTNIYYIVE